MNFCEWTKNMNSSKMAEIEAVAREAEKARERDEDIALDEYYESEDRNGWEYIFYTEFDE